MNPPLSAVADQVACEDRGQPRYNGGPSGNAHFWLQSTFWLPTKRKFKGMAKNGWDPAWLVAMTRAWQEGDMMTHCNSLVASFIRSVVLTSAGWSTRKGRGEGQARVEAELPIPSLSFVKFITVNSDFAN